MRANCASSKSGGSSGIRAGSTSGITRSLCIFAHDAASSSGDASAAPWNVSGGPNNLRGLSGVRLRSTGAGASSCRCAGLAGSAGTSPRPSSWSVSGAASSCGAARLPGSCRSTETPSSTKSSGMTSGSGIGAGRGVLRPTAVGSRGATNGSTSAPSRGTGVPSRKPAPTASSSSSSGDGLGGLPRDGSREMAASISAGVIGRGVGVLSGTGAARGATSSTMSSGPTGMMRLRRTTGASSAMSSALAARSSTRSAPPVICLTKRSSAEGSAMYPFAALTSTLGRGAGPTFLRRILAPLMARLGAPESFALAPAFTAVPINPGSSTAAIARSTFDHSGIGCAGSMERNTAAPALPRLLPADAAAFTSGGNTAAPPAATPPPTAALTSRSRVVAGRIVPSSFCDWSFDW